MSAAVALHDKWRSAWAVTSEKVAEAVNRIILTGNPVRVIAYGSRARGDASEDSDLDIAVILDRIDPQVPVPVRSSLFRGIPVDIDLLVTDVEQHNRFRTCLNNVHREIATDGVVLYDRDRDAGANADSIKKISFR